VTAVGGMYVGVKDAWWMFSNVGDSTGSLKLREISYDFINTETFLYICIGFLYAVRYFITEIH